MDRIKHNSSTVVCPVIDSISDKTLEYQYTGSTEVNLGGFDWEMQVNEIFLTMFRDALKSSEIFLLIMHF